MEYLIRTYTNEGDLVLDTHSMAHGRHRAGRVNRGGSGLAAHLSTQGQGIPAATTTKRLTASLNGGYVRTHLFNL